ncbi:MAG TPA: Na+/H+ antiporter NhaA [Gaiellaceae bacterium]|nr:Na+/H+ antiporter NhaA [Gaiellaceae bacterium]
MSEAQATQLAGRTAWARSIETPLRSFLRTETGGAAVLLAATVAALVWVNADAHSYERVWTTQLEIRVGGHGIAQDLRAWLNTGLMTLFFLVVGLEARREFDLGELRDRRRLALPLAAGIGGMVVPVAIYLAANAGRGSAHGWGTAMSTDTAFALGMLALVGPRFPDRLRAFLLTVAVVDDLAALLVIAAAYSSHVSGVWLVAGVALLAAGAALAVAGVRRGFLYAGLGLAAWVALHESGVDPVVTGLAFGLLTVARPAARGDLERATDLFRLFREQPTADLEREAREGIRLALAPNDRLQRLWHPWTSYAIVPLFALANAGVALGGGFLGHAFSSPITLGIFFGYLAGKPVGIVGAAAVLAKLSRGRVRPPVGWAAVAGGGTIAGIGFTVSLLIASLAFHGTQLAEAKVGVLGAALASALVTWLLFRATARLPLRSRVRALLGTTESIVDLATPVDPERDHVRGPEDAPVTLVEYGDFECSYCGQAETIIRELLASLGDEVRYVWRHLPLTDVHPRAQLASEAAEAAAAQGRFWEYYDLLLSRQDALAAKHLLAYADELGLDAARFESDLRAHAGAPHIAEDVDGADLSGVTGTPTFFVNGLRHYGAYDVETLTREVRLARARALAAS